MASSPLTPNCDMSVLAASMACLKSTLYVSDKARMVSVILSDARPSSPVVTVVIWSCLASSLLYLAHASVALPMMAMPAPIPAYMSAVLLVSSSVALAVSPSLCPMVSITPPNSPNLPEPPESSLLMSAKSFFVSWMRVLSWSRELFKATPKSPFFSSSVSRLYCNDRSVNAFVSSLILPRASLLTVSICPIPATNAFSSFLRMASVPPTLRHASSIWSKPCDALFILESYSDDSTFNLVITSAIAYCLSY